MTAPEQSLDTLDWDVPTYRADVFAPKSSRHVIIMPVINEGERIRQQIRDMFALNQHLIADIVVVDGGSTDGSLDVAFLTDHKLRALLTKTGPGKLSAQLRCAYAWALQEGYDGIVTIDGNGKDGVDAVPQFIDGLDNGYGYLQASRFLKGGYSKNTPLSRYLAIRFIHAPLQSLAAGYWFTDTTQGFRGYSRDYLLDIGVKPFRACFERYELLAYLTARAKQLGYKVKEIPTSRVYPDGEPTPTKISGLGALWDLITVLFAVLFRKYHPK